jgi:hypothetical protein
MENKQEKAGERDKSIIKNNRKQYTVVQQVE